MSPYRAAPPYVDARPSPDAQPLLDARYAVLASAERLLPIKLSPFYRAKVDEEVRALGHARGPLHRTVRPTAERLNLRAPGEVRDFVDDRHNMPSASSGAIVQKYADRVLFMPTSTCAAHCQYCFRQDVLSSWHGQGLAALDGAVEELQAHLAAHPRATEVILSGGDPMTLPLGALERILRPLHANPQVRHLRIHTKTIVFSPAVFDDPAKLALLAECGVRLVFHIVHPYEVCDVVRRTIGRIRAAGIRCYNQFPLLRGVNDDAALLVEHLTRLDELDVRNLSVFVPEPVVGSVPFRLRWSRFERLVDEVNWSTPSWVNATRFLLDTPIGKVRREDLVARDAERDVLTFARDGRTVDYPDLPAELDVPGDPAIMRWRG